MAYQLEQPLEKERLAKEAMLEVFGADTTKEFTFDHPCPDNNPSALQEEMERCEKALKLERYLPRVAVGVIRARYRLASDRFDILRNPAFRRNYVSTARNQYDALRARMVPLCLEPAWLDLELERHGVNPGTLEGWTQEQYDLLSEHLRGLEEVSAKVDAENKRGARKNKKQQEKQLVAQAATSTKLSDNDLALGQRAFEFLTANKADAKFTSLEMEKKLNDAVITDEECDELLSAALELGWDPDDQPKQLTLTQQIEAQPEIPFLLDKAESGPAKIVEDGKTQPQEVDHVAPLENTTQTNAKSGIIDVETVEPPIQERTNVDAVALPAVVMQEGKPTAEQPVQQVEGQVVVVENGIPKDAKTGEVLISQEDAEVLLGANVPADAVLKARRVAGAIHFLQNQCVDIASVACGMINERLRGINGLLYHFQSTLRLVYEPQLKRDKNGKITPKSVAILEEGVKIYFEKTGGIRCKSSKELTKMLNALPKKDFLALGGKVVEARDWDIEELKKLYDAGEELLQDYFEKKEENEVGLIKIGTGQAGWSPSRIGDAWKLTKVPMLTAKVDDGTELKQIGEAA